MTDKLRSVKVLLIEDSTDAALMMRALLESDHCSVSVAHSGTEGVTRALEEKPDIVICDLGLPGMDGYEVARELRNNSELKQTRLIALTGYALEEDRRRSLQAGFDYHLVKPVDIDALERLVAPPN